VSTCALVAAANRLPLNRVLREGMETWETSPGGLVSALTPLLQERECAWVGWSGRTGRTPRPFTHDGIHFVPVPLSRQEVDACYEGFSNRSLWPLYHNAVRTPEYHRHWWDPYVDVNRRFAEHIAGVLAPGGTAWIQDYHLQLVPKMLRAIRPDASISFFLHIPFPPAELFTQLPWRREILAGLLGADVVGFQTTQAAQNFRRLCRRFHSVEGAQRLRFENRTIRVSAFPISIDAGRFERLARTPAIRTRAKEIRARLRPQETILLGVDRLDYTKGIDRRLKAFDTLLTKDPDLARRTVFIQIAVPSRERVTDYADLRADIEGMVGHINGRHSRGGIVPVHYMYRSLPADELVAYYLAADVMVVTSLCDGMNLVAKEYVTCRTDASGVLLLSEFTGAAQELHQALLANPHDVDGLAAALAEAITMPAAQKRRRMKAMRRTVREHDVYRWARAVLGTRN
jgi:trehalose 6-phosphate synthase